MRTQFTIPFFKGLEGRLQTLSRTGKVVFGILAGIFTLSALGLLIMVNNAFLVSIPMTGGTLREGVVGVPRFVNPLLAVTDADKDLVALTYSGLMRQLPSGELIPDLAQSYTISDDGRTYDFILKDKIYFQDGKPITADDVIFTIQKSQDPTINSTKKVNWDNVAIEKVTNREIKFILKQPYTPFLENTTLGILPKHLWNDITADTFSLNVLNSNPVGSGLYKVSGIDKNDSGPVAYHLVATDSNPFNKTLYISTIELRFYPNEAMLVEAYKKGDVDAVNSLSPADTVKLDQEGARILQSSLPRIFGVFFNQSSNPILANHDVRQALNMSVNREYIVNNTLRGYGEPLEQAVPENFSISASSSIPTTGDIKGANALLDKSGWTVDGDGIRIKKTTAGIVRLAFSITTGDAQELKDTATILKEEWRKIGADVSIKVFEGGYLNQNIIRPRRYDALLFGQVVNRDLDLFAFWHSSQIADPGLNIAQYTNTTVDRLLENLRSVKTAEQRLKSYTDLNTQLMKDVPAVFLYSPSFIYIIPPKLQGLTLTSLSVPSERFGSIYDWYTKTDEVWKIFLNK